jgi:hypothetical protein
MTKEINWEQIDKMLIAGCNGIQCAAAVGIHHDTLYDRCVLEKNTSFSVYSQQKRAHGDGLLHAAQFQKAYKDGNPTMLIWLGKQRLHQKEDLENTDVKNLESKFDEQMGQVLSLLSTERESDLNIEESNINNETKS